MHASERETAIIQLVAEKGFVSFNEIERRLDASPATLRRDLARMSRQRRISRVRGGAKIINHGEVRSPEPYLSGVPFHDNIHLNQNQKKAIGLAAAALCTAGEAVMIDGGSTTLQMCPHLDGLGLQVLTNSLHIVSALLPQPSTRVLLPGGALFREQNIILSAPGDDLMPRFHAPKLFMGAAALGAQGLMQADVVLVAAERRLIDRAEQLIVLADSSKFRTTSGHVVCNLEEIDVVVTDSDLEERYRKMIEAAGVRLIVA
jgi:DeoR family ulaG and ulaABCDEF operon transcriptional repressor